MLLANFKMNFNKEKDDALQKNELKQSTQLCQNFLNDICKFFSKLNPCQTICWKQLLEVIFE